MLKFLDYYIVKEFHRISFAIILLFFPFIFLADFVISGNFLFNAACSNILFRYGQMLPLILLLSSYLTTVNILYKHDIIMFLNLGCSKLTAIKPIIFIGLMYSFIYYFIILPSNQYCFSSKLLSVQWMVVPQDSKTLFIHKKDKNKYDVFSFDKSLDKSEKLVKENLDIPDDFYINWNDVKKLSYRDLNECERYLKRHKWSTNDIIKQKFIYLYKFFLFFLMLLCGYVIAMNRSLFLLLIIFLVSNWIDILAFYLSLKYCILILCTNLIIWFIFPLYYFLF